MLSVNISGGEKVEGEGEGTGWEEEEEGLGVKVEGGTRRGGVKTIADIRGRRRRRVKAREAIIGPKKGYL